MNHYGASLLNPMQSPSEQTNAAEKLFEMLKFYEALKSSQLNLKCYRNILSFIEEKYKEIFVNDSDTDCRFILEKYMLLRMEAYTTILKFCLIPSFYYLPIACYLNNKIKHLQNELEMTTLTDYIRNQLYNHYPNLKNAEPEPSEITEKMILIHIWYSNVNHVALQTKKIYASFWPENTANKSNYYIVRGTLKTYEQDKNHYGRMPDDTVIIKNNNNILDTNAINAAFERFSANADSLNWSLFSDIWQRSCYSSDNNYQYQNCSGLVISLLEKGGIDKVIVDYDYMQGKRNHLFALLTSPVIYTAFIIFPAVILKKTQDRFIIWGTAGLSISIFYRLLRIEDIIPSKMPLNWADIFTLTGIIVGDYLVYTFLGHVVNISNKIGKAVISILLLPILGWIVSKLTHLLSRFGNFTANCICYGTYFLVRPKGVYRLALQICNVQDYSYQVRHASKAWRGYFGYLPYTFWQWIIPSMLERTIHNKIVGYYLGIILGTLVGFSFRKFLQYRITYGVYGKSLDKALQFADINDVDWNNSKTKNLIYRSKVFTRSYYSNQFLALSTTIVNISLGLVNDCYQKSDNPNRWIQMLLSYTSVIFGFLACVIIFHYYLKFTDKNDKDNSTFLNSTMSCSHYSINNNYNNNLNIFSSSNNDEENKNEENNEVKKPLLLYQQDGIDDYLSLA